MNHFSDPVLVLQINISFTSTVLRILQFYTDKIFYIYLHIYVGDERTPESSLWNFGKTP